MQREELILIGGDDFIHKTNLFFLFQKASISPVKIL